MSHAFVSKGPSIKHRKSCEPSDQEPLTDRRPAHPPSFTAEVSGGPPMIRERSVSLLTFSLKIRLESLTTGSNVRHLLLGGSQPKSEVFARSDRRIGPAALPVGFLCGLGVEMIHSPDNRGCSIFGPPMVEHSQDNESVYVFIYAIANGIYVAAGCPP